MKKDNYNVTLMSALTVVGYFAGSTVATLAGQSSHIVKLLSGSFGAVLAAFVHFLITWKKRPEAIKAMFVEQHDERLKTIREKAGHLTFILLLVLLFLMSFFSMVNENYEFLFFSGGLYIILALIYFSLIWYLKKVI